MIKRSTGLWLSAAFVNALAAAPAMAQASEEGAISSDIIVTARRTEERLQDVPISMTVFSQEKLTNLNVVNAADLATYTPSLAINQRYGAEKSSFSIRGFVQDQATAPSVGVYFADVVAPRGFGGTTSGDSAPTGSFMDLQNVQVLKGPQGTLFGRNTTGGAVLLVPQKPTDNLEGSVEGSIGNYDMRRVQGVLNVPLADTFKVRLAVDRQKRDGYMKNYSGIGPEDYNDTNYFAARLSVLAELTPNLENYTIATYSRSTTNGYAARLIGCTPGFPTGAGPLLAGPACAQIARQAGRSDLGVEVSNPDPYQNLTIWQVINTTTWQASDTLTVKNIVSYGELRERSSFSLNSDNFALTPAPGVSIPFKYILLNPSPRGDNASQSTFTEEVQFQGNLADGRLQWQAGGYMEVSRPIGWSAGYTGILLNCSRPIDITTCTNPIGAGQISASATKFSFDSRALYAQATYKFTDQLSLTGGFRYTWDKTTGLGQTTRLNIPVVPGGTVTRQCNDITRFNAGRGADGRLIPLLVTDPGQCQIVIPQKSSAPTWLVGIDYKPTSDMLIYAKYARGYRTGGVNLTTIGLEGWDQEKVEAYEIGAKTSFGGGDMRGYFNIAGFYNDFSNQQLTANGVSNTPGFSGAAPIINAGKSRIYGVEVDAGATLFDALKLEAGYTYLNTKLQQIDPVIIPPDAPYSSITARSRAGEPLPLSPRHRLSLTASYTLRGGDGVGDFTVGANYIYTAKALISFQTLPRFQYLPSSKIVNLNASWNDVLGAPVDISAFATNVTNRKYRIAILESYLSTGFEGALFAPPRMYGLRIKYRFGQ